MLQCSNPNLSFSLVSIFRYSKEWFLPPLLRFKECIMKLKIMRIRTAYEQDAESLRKLLEELGYRISVPCLEKKITLLTSDPNSGLYVYELGGSILGLLSVYFIPQLAVEGDFARISYFVVDENCRNKGIGKEMEKFCEMLASERKCDRIEVHCHEGRKEAHWFYLERGYEESPKYLVKHLG